MAELMCFDPRLTLHAPHSPSRSPCLQAMAPLWGSVAVAGAGGRGLGRIRSGGGGFRAAHLLCCSQGPSGSDHCAVCSSAGGNWPCCVTAAMQPASPLSSRATVCPFSSCRFTLVVMPLDITQNIAVQWLAGSIACQTLVFLKLTAMVCCSFPACGHWTRLPVSNTPPTWTSLSWRETPGGGQGT